MFTLKSPKGGRTLKNWPVEGRALIKHPVGVFSEEPDCSYGSEGASLQVGRVGRFS